MADTAFSPLPQHSPNVADLIGPDPDPGVPHVRFMEVSTLSGAATMSGDTGKMGNQTDTALFMGLRERADVIVVGSRTVEIEDYGGAQPTDARPTPAPIAVITNSFRVDPQSRFFTEAITPPIIVANDDAMNDSELAEKRQQLADAGAELLNSGRGTATEIVRALSDRGLNNIVCEGGPGIFGLFTAGNVVNQLYLTLDPHFTASVENPLVSDKASKALGLNSEHAVALTLENLAIDTDSTLFLRYGVAPQS